MNISQIIIDTRVALGLNPSAAPSLIHDEQQLTVDAAIRAAIPAAVEKAHLEAPVEWLDSALSVSATIIWHDTEPQGYMALPQDFLRLVSVKMDQWEVAVTEAITASHPLYAQQHSRYAGLRGTPQRPVAAIVRRASGLVLEFYGCSTRDAALEWLLYIPMAQVRNEAIDISPRCYPQVIQILKSQIPSCT